MALHGCTHTFEELANEVLPEIFETLQRSLMQPASVRDCLQNSAQLPPNAGCYVFLRAERPIYVGIAKNIRRRILDHLSNDPSRANLAVRVAAKNLQVGLPAIKKHVQFSTAFTSASEQLLDCKVAWVPIENPLVMYLFEPYCAMKLDTAEFNFFNTLQILSPSKR